MRLTLFRDLLSLLVLTFLAAIVLMLPWLNPPESGQRSITAPATLCFFLAWEDGATADLDLWVKLPANPPIGYTSRNTLYGDLLRDDLGRTNDPTDANLEMTCARVKRVSEGVKVAIQLYNPHGDLPPIRAEVVAVMVALGRVEVLARSEVALREMCEEVVVMRGSPDGALVSVNERAAERMGAVCAQQGVAP